MSDLSLIMFNTVKTTLFFMFSLCLSYAANASPDLEETDFDDTRLEEPLVHPDWFKTSLGNLNDDLKESVANGKKGLIVYFGQQNCAYCEQFLNVNLGIEEIQNYLRGNFDIVPIDIWGINDVIDTDGKEYSEREFSLHYKTNFTPSLVFYDRDGKPVFRLRGYYPPYKFRAALQYVVEGFYKKETFRDYLERAVPGTFFKLGGLNERDFFTQPPYNLKTLSSPEKPLVIFFEQGQCHACDLLHTSPLSNTATLVELEKMNAVQLDMWADTSIILQDGSKTSAKKWAEQLQIFHAPTMVFFDNNGNEIIRIDSVVKFYRLLGVLDYVTRKGYLKENDYQLWRLKQRKTN